MLASPAVQLTEDEEEVARILGQLPKLVLKSRECCFPVTLHWGARRRRSVPSDNPSPSPSARDGGGEVPNKKGGEGPASSPATPLSFSPSGGEEANTDINGRPSASPPSSKPSKSTKRHKERVNEQNQTITSLSADKVNLQRSVAEAKSRLQLLKARNSRLRDIRLKFLMAKAVSDRQRQQQQQQRRAYISSMVGPTTLRLMPVPAHLAGRAEPAAFPIGPAGNPWREVGYAAAEAKGSRGRSPHGGVVPDLNSSAEEAAAGLELALGLEKGVQNKAAMSAQARKRRIEKQREKSSYYLAAASSLDVNYNKVPRLG